MQKYPIWLRAICEDEVSESEWIFEHAEHGPKAKLHPYLIDVFSRLGKVTGKYLPETGIISPVARYGLSGIRVQSLPRFVLGFLWFMFRFFRRRRTSTREWPPFLFFYDKKDLAGLCICHVQIRMVDTAETPSSRLCQRILFEAEISFKKPLTRLHPRSTKSSGW